MNVGALTLVFVVGAGTDAVPRTGNGLARRISTECALELRIDPSLSAAAARHGEQVLGHETEAPETSIRAFGLGDPEVLPVTSVGPNARQVFARVAGQCPSSAFGATHVGAGWARREGRWAAVVLYSRRFIDWSPARWGTGFQVTGSGGQLDNGRLAWLRGCSKELLCDRAEERPWTGGRKIALGSADVVELLADTEAGPTVVGLWVRPGLAPGMSEAVESPGPAWTEIRRRRGLPSGRESAALTQAAQAHAAFVCRQGRARHVDDRGRRPQNRARKAGWTGPVAENVAVARNLERAFENLLLSPSHHATLVDPRVRSFGFGVAKAPGKVCLVQLFGQR